MYSIMKKYFILSHLMMYTSMYWLC